MAEVIAGARTYVDVPAPEVARGGVMSVASVVDDPDVHALMGALYLTDACATAEEWDEWCTMTPSSPKVFDTGPDVVEGDPFVVYAGVSCDFQKMDEAKARARKRFEYAERRMVDRAVAAWLAANADTIPGTGASITEAVGAAEQYAAEAYGGVPNVLMSIAMTACACHAHVVYPALNGALSTCQGSRVANLAVDTDTVYVTGQITLLRGPVEVIAVPSLGGTNAAPPRALAERIYVPLMECVAGKIDATCE